MTTRRTRRRRSGGKWVALVVAVLAGLYFSRGFFQRFHVTYPPNAFHQVKRADLLVSIVEEGALRALNETVVRSGLEGINRIIHLVPEGSWVEKGDLLVELDSSGLKDRFNEQELLRQERLFQMLQAQGNLSIQRSLVESQIKEAELRIENAQSDLEKYRDGDAPLLIKTVEARSGVLAEQVRIASERYARTAELVQAGNATKSELEADALSLRREQLALGQYQEDLRLIKKYDQPKQVRLLQSKVEQAQAEFDRLKQRTSNEIAQAEADVKTSQGALTLLEESLESQRRRLENAKILAPQNGLVVYAQVSPFQSWGGDERRREEGRPRGGRGGEGGGGEFRGGGRRGGRSNSDPNSQGQGSQGGGGGNSSGSGSSVSESVASGNQRIASAVSGSPATEPGGSGGGTGSGGGPSGGRSGGGGTSGGGGSGGGSSGGSGGGSGGGQNASSAAGAFASYPSMRPSSLLGASAVTNSSAAGAGGAGASSTAAAGEQQNAPSNIGNSANSNLRSSWQNNRDFGGFESSGQSAILEAGMMVRQRQELIRLPDVSKMIAEVTIEEARVAQVRSGMTAYVQVKNTPQRRFKGTVRRVALLPDAQASWMNPNKKVFPADILIDEELPLLKPGVSVTAEVIITNLTKVLSVPIQTVVRFNGENVCFVKKDSRVAPVAVTTGWFNDAFVEITSGLKEGDLVLLAPIYDEEFEESEGGDEEAQVGAAASPSPAPAPPAEEPPAEGRGFQRRNSDPANDGPTRGEVPERGRNRPGRRPPNPSNGPE